MTEEKIKPEQITKADTILRQFEDGSLAREAKASIAREAKKDGAIITAKKYGLPMQAVRAWIGAYCRVDRKALKRDVPAVADLPEPCKVEAEAKDNMHLPSLPAFSNCWQPEVQIAWLDAWKTSRVCEN